VSVIQFIKSGKWKVGEEAIGRRLGVDWWALGTGFTWNPKDMSEPEARAREAWRTAKDKLSCGDYEMVLLDEVTYPINCGWIDWTTWCRPSDKTPSGELDPHRTRCGGRAHRGGRHRHGDTKIKHAFDQGVRAKRGIDL
jgi:cob(I)alamin adenosyltransferase